MTDFFFFFFFSFVKSGVGGRGGISFNSLNFIAN